MKNPNTFAVSFKARAARGEGNSAAIYLKITVNKVIREASLKYAVDLKYWDNKRGRPKLVNDLMHQLNTELEKEAGLVCDAFKAIEWEGGLLSADSVKSRYLGIEVAETPYTLRLLMQEYEKDQKTELALGTWKNYVTTYKYINLCLNDKMPAKDIRIANLNHSFLSELKTYIREHPAKNRRPATQNGLAKHLERVKRMVNWAQQAGKLTVNLIEKYPTPKKKYNRKYITEAEFADLEVCELVDPMLNFARNLFIFSAYTGIAYGDLMALTPVDLIVGRDGQRWVTNQRIKTDNPFLVPLLRQPLAILKQYWEDEAAVARGGLFPYISNQKLNVLLKIISTARGYSHPLHFHDARHIFGTYTTLARGVPIESVSKMMGHSKLSTTQIYAKIVAAKVKEDMAVLQEKLDKQLPATLLLQQVSQDQIIQRHKTEATLEVVSVDSTEEVIETQPAAGAGHELSINSTANQFKITYITTR